MKAKPSVGFPFFGVFPSGHILNTTKIVNVLVFIHTSAEILQMQQILQILPAYSGNYFCGDLPVIMYEMSFQS
jgi:hypothetical protein